MVSSIARTAVAAVALTLARSAHAEPLSLTLDDALARAEVRAPDVVAARQTVREAYARRTGAGIVLPTNPRLTVDARPPITGGGNLSDLGYGATLELLGEVGGAPSARIREAERGAGVAEADLAGERLRARAAAFSAYVRASIASARIEETQRLIEAAQRILDASKQRAGAGAAGDIEEAIAAGDRFQLEAALAGATRQRESELAVLRDVDDLAAGAPIVLATAIGAPPEAASTAELLATAQRSRPELTQLSARIALFDATKERLERETFPKIGGYVGVDAAPLSPIFGIVGVAVELPFAQRNQGPRAVVETARAGDVERLDLVKRRIEREVVAARAAYEARRSELATLESSALPAAERALELVEIGWRAGRFDVFRVASAARDVARARTLRLDALEAAWLGRVELERTTGRVGGVR